MTDNEYTTVRIKKSDLALLKEQARRSFRSVPQEIAAILEVMLKFQVDRLPSPEDADRPLVLTPKE